MGVEIRKVPPGFRHPVDEDGEFIVGGHHELLYDLDPATLTACQLYENVTEGSPVSPVFSDHEALGAWLAEQGWSKAAVASLIELGHAPSFVVRR